MKKNKSFSLIEILIASTIFSVVILVVLSTVAMLSSVESGLKSAKVVNSTSSYVLESMFRDIAEADESLSINGGITYHAFTLSNSIPSSIIYSGGTLPNDFCEDASIPKSGILLHVNDEYKFYYLDTNNKINLRTDSDLVDLFSPSGSYREFVIAGSDKVIISKFAVTGIASTSNPWAKIDIEIKSSNFIKSEETFKFSTMVSTRKITW
ncbi:MAG: prepilin-type N-terminal cleavage/methylation domain-containing protein [Patescibacteria group bacterium]|jgi:type II secretory pathway pseudopilin PulG